MWTFCSSSQQAAKALLQFPFQTHKMHWLIGGQSAFPPFILLGRILHKIGSERSGTHCTNMGKSAMVSTVVRESCRSPNHHSRNTNTPPQPSGKAPPIGDPKLSKTGHLESVWGQVKDRGLSEEAFMEMWHQEIVFICLVKVGSLGQWKELGSLSKTYNSSYWILNDTIQGGKAIFHHEFV